MQSEPVGMQIIIQREKSGPFKLTIPEWISDSFGELVLFSFDGETLEIRRAE